MLHSLGVSQEAQLRKQQEHLNTLTGATQEPRVVLRLLNSVGYFDLAEKLLLEGKEAVERSISKIVNKEYGKMLNKRSEQNCRTLNTKVETGPGSSWRETRALILGTYLIDCVVFSTRGKRPAADLMSGGELDGDTFKSRPPRLCAH